MVCGCFGSRRFGADSSVHTIWCSVRSLTIKFSTDCKLIYTCRSGMTYRVVCLWKTLPYTRNNQSVIFDGATQLRDVSPYHGTNGVLETPGGHLSPTRTITPMEGELTPGLRLMAWRAVHSSTVGVNSLSSHCILEVNYNPTQHIEVAEWADDCKLQAHPSRRPLQELCVLNEWQRNVALPVATFTHQLFVTVLSMSGCSNYDIRPVTDRVRPRTSWL